MENELPAASDEAFLLLLFQKRALASEVKLKLCPICLHDVFDSIEKVMSNRLIGFPLRSSFLLWLEISWFGD